MSEKPVAVAASHSSRTKGAKGGKFTSKRKAAKVKGPSGKPVHLEGLRRDAMSSPLRAGSQGSSVGMVEPAHPSCRPTVMLRTPEQDGPRKASEPAEKEEGQVAVVRVEKDKNVIEEKEREEVEGGGFATGGERERRGEETLAGAAEYGMFGFEDVDKNDPQSFPSALAVARAFDDINSVAYPQGIRSPIIELNRNACKGKFKYDRNFLLQFVSVCKDKPNNLSPLHGLGIDASEFGCQQSSSIGTSREGYTEHIIAFETT